MSKPLHKDRSFWIVVVTVLVAVNAAQLYFTVPWFKQRLAARPREAEGLQIVHGRVGRHSSPSARSRSRWAMMA